MTDPNHSNGRRDFLRIGVAGTAIAAGTALLGDRLFAQVKETAEKKPKAKCKQLILIYANGGPAQLDTFDPKPGQKTAAPFKVIKTSVPGFTPVEYLPEIAKLAKDFCLIKSMRSGVVDHSHARYLMHTGWESNPTMKHPGIGSIVSHQMGKADFDLPNFVKLGGNPFPAGYLGGDHNPFLVKKPGSKIENLEYAAGSNKKRMERRMKLLGKMEEKFAKEHGKEAVEARKAVREKARRLMDSPLRAKFYIEDVPDKVKKAYGDSTFAKSCLIARRLIEVGVAAVEINFGGWDTHDDGFKKNMANCKTLDQPYAMLIKELKDRGLLDTTMVVWYGDFGRKPNVTATEGRGHYAKNYCALLAGGGVKGGQVIGETNEDGTELITDYHRPRDLFATFGHLMGWDVKKTFHAGERPAFLVHKQGKPITKVYS